ncbi:hypothetical protein N7U66_08965 [Lacinutrix neustonica]|uniref:Uncharacterized protein n=1 Tax=Lacinutrix neustonica TaxID=2980107 RepID=A0A9E8MZ69_9FLAO|nr:hypothetical protein [Lacinutrix neustonica]WAC03580.1 hypothetical protein N7U66_08965 [Lacinutrix neustonica]
MFGSPIGVEAALNIFKKDSSFTTVNQKAKLFYQINRRHRFYFGVDNTQSNNLLTDNPMLSINNYNSNFLSTRYEYEHRNNKKQLFQIKTLAQLEFGFGNREVLNNKNQQTKLFLNTHHIFFLNAKNSVFLRANASLLNSEIISKMNSLDLVASIPSEGLQKTASPLPSTPY